MTAPILMRRSGDQGAYLVHALRRHAEWSGLNGLHVPKGLDELVAMLLGVSEGQWGSSVATTTTTSESRVMAPLAVTYETAAQMLGVSLSAFKKRVLNHEVQAVLPGVLKRVRVADIQALVARAGQETG
jgi:hypothetical protein